jgi:hypothetical protein
MRIQTLALLTIITAALILVPPSNADTLRFADGREVEGIIKKVEAGTVWVAVGKEEQAFSILDVLSMDFNTPHLAPTPDVPLEHFLKNIEAQEIVRHIEELKKSAEEIRTMLGTIRSYWEAKQPVTATEIAGWESAKEEFRKPLDRYQEVLNDIYFHLLAQVDEYNELAAQANKVYVGVKGIRTGSSLVAKDMQRLPLKRFVPANWYNTIFYDGYNVGFSEAQIKLNTTKNHE